MGLGVFVRFGSLPKTPMCGLFLAGSDILKQLPQLGSPTTARTLFYKHAPPTLKLLFTLLRFETVPPLNGVVSSKLAQGEVSPSLLEAQGRRTFLTASPASALKTRPGEVAALHPLST